MDWKEIKIFVSSTFNDMHAERDYLVTEVFPELSEWCEQRRIRLTDIDLRWGVTREDAESGNTVKACLNCIDECRPFFLCFLGQRRGWVPDLNADIGADTLAHYQQLRSRLGIYSITEMEVEHATLAPMTRLLQGGPYTPDKSKALFFFRSDPFAGDVLTEEQKKIYTNAGAADEEAEDRRLAGSKEWISAEWEPYLYECRWDPEKEITELASLGDVCRGGLTDFTVSGTPLREIILSEMKKLIEQEYPDHVPVTSHDRFDEDAMEQQLYSQTAVFDFTGREKELAGILAHTASDSLSWAGGEGEALFITAPEGIGKTALLASSYKMLSDSGYRPIFRSCALTDLSMTMDDLFLSIGNEAGLFRASVRNPQLPRRIDTDFLKDLLDKGYDTLIIDGLDHAAGRESISCLKAIPAGFHLIISSDDPEEWRNFRFLYKTMELRGLVMAQERSDMIDSYLLRTLKKLDDEQRYAIISAPGSAYPMYIRLVLNELRTFGSFADLTEKIKRFGDTPESAFEELLRTLSGESGIADEITGMLLYARDGLDEDELMSGLKMLGLYTESEESDLRMKLRMFIRRIRPYLVRVNGRYSVLNRSFENAGRSLHGEREAGFRHALIHIYEENLRAAPLQTPNEWNEVHGAHELLYQMEMLGEWDGIRYALNNPEIFRNLRPDDYRGEYRNGTFFRSYKDVFNNEGGSDAGAPAGFSLDASRSEDRGHYRMLADVFISKAMDNLGVIRRLYPHPYAPKCAALRAKEDPTEFFRFRDLFYEVIEYARIAFRYERISMECGRENLPELEAEKSRFDKKSGAVQSFMDYLSHFGGDETGLSYKIEDMADSALSEYAGIERALAACI